MCLDRLLVRIWSRYRSQSMERVVVKCAYRDQTCVYVLHHGANLECLGAFTVAQ